MKCQQSLLFLLILLFTFSCTLKSIENKLLGTWVVESFILNEKELIWEELRVNMFTFYKDGTCMLPIRDLNKKDKANWEIIKETNKFYLSIFNSEDPIFNDRFLIDFNYREFGDATHTIVELSSSNLFIKASK